MTSISPMFALCSLCDLTSLLACDNHRPLQTLNCSCTAMTTGSLLVNHSTRPLPCPFITQLFDRVVKKHISSLKVMKGSWPVHLMIGNGIEIEVHSLTEMVWCNKLWKWEIWLRSPRSTKCNSFSLWEQHALCFAIINTDWHVMLIGSVRLSSQCLS